MNTHFDQKQSNENIFSIEDSSDSPINFNDLNVFTDLKFKSKLNLSIQKECK